MSFETQPILTKEVNDAFMEAYAYAKKNLHQYLTVDTVMLHLVKIPNAKRIFEGVSVNIEEFEATTRLHLNDEENNPRVKNEEEYAGAGPSSTSTLRDWIIEANQLQRSNGRDAVDEEALIITLFSSILEDTYTLYFLDQKEINRSHVYNFLQHGQTRDEQENEEQSERSEMSSSSNSKSPLKKFAVLLNARAAEGKIDPVIGRTKEIENVITILAQRRKNNPMLVGDAGVGKTAIAEGLALYIVEKKVPKQLQDLRIYSVDMGALLAGTKFRGDFEDRLDKLIKEATKDPNIVLFIDEIHTIIGAGSAGGGSMDAANILKPSLSNGSLKVIGATTFDEYKKIFEKETALARRFQKIDIEEPTPEEAIEIINGLKKSYEEFHGLTFTQEAVKAAVHLTVKYMTDRKLPDKAIDMIDMAGAKLKLAGEGVKEVTEQHISEILAKIANIPVGTMVASEKEKLKNLRDNLQASIFGQDEAINKIVKSVMLSRANLVGKDKPIASFLMAGPTGVGKTELARQVSKNLDMPLIRFDMSEYMEKHSVAKLIGAPAGYVGHEDGGQLVSAVRKNPHCIILLDEIEKAHPDVFNIFLQVMDYGKLTDNQGKKADFKNVIIMLTSNAGATQIAKTAMGFGASSTGETESEKNARDEVVKKAFKPEFINRIDAIIQFNPLSKENIIQVVSKQLVNLDSLLKLKNIQATFTDELKQYIADKAYDPKMGARPIERFVEANIAQVLSEEIIWGKLENGGNVIIDTDGSSITFNYEKDIVKEILNTTSPKKRARKVDKATT